MARQLLLNLKGDAYEVMVSGEKTEEFRRPSQWLLSRLQREYDVVKFVHGYGRTRPWFVCRLRRIEECQEEFTAEYSNGLSVKVMPRDKILFLGQIIARG